MDVVVTHSIRTGQDMMLVTQWLNERIAPNKWCWSAKWEYKGMKILKMLVEFNDDVSPTFITLFILRWGG
jgi:hypothetical protein